MIRYISETIDCCIFFERHFFRNFKPKQKPCKCFLPFLLHLFSNDRKSGEKLIFPNYQQSSIKTRNLKVIPFIKHKPVTNNFQFMTRFLYLVDLNGHQMSLPCSYGNQKVGCHCRYAPQFNSCSRAAVCKLEYLSKFWKNMQQINECSKLIKIV